MLRFSSVYGDPDGGTLNENSFSLQKGIIQWAMVYHIQPGSEVVELVENRFFHRKTEAEQWFAKNYKKESFIQPKAIAILGGRIMTLPYEALGESDKKTKETFLRLQKAFAALGYAVKWWYHGPGFNPHVMTGPDMYNKKHPHCLMGDPYGHQDCVRCARAALARATIGREKQSGLAD